MNEVKAIAETAQSIGDFGALIVIGSAFIVLSLGMWIAIFKWFKTIINRILGQQTESMRQLAEIQRENNRMLKFMSDGLKTETMLRIRNLTGFAFDLSVEQVCRLVKRIRKENHIADRKTTATKIRKCLQVIHDDRNSRFDPFTYGGKPLSDYCSKKWVEDVAKVIESELYNEDGENNARAYTNIKLAYDNIKTDFYQRLND